MRFTYKRDILLRFGIVCDKLNNPLPTLEHRSMFLFFHVNMTKVSKINQYRRA